MTWLLAGNFLYSLYQWSLVALMAKFWGSVHVGHFALGLALSAPVFLFSNLNLRTVLATDVNNEYDLATFFRLRLVLSLLALLLVCVMALFAGEGRGGVLIILLVASLKFVESFSDLSYGALQHCQNLRMVGISMALKSVFSFLLAFFLFRQGASIWLVLTLILLVWAVVFLFFDLPRARKSWNRSLAVVSGASPTFSIFGDWSGAKKLLRFALPLGFAAALVSLDANIPRYVVKGLQGSSELGIYAGIGFIIIAGNNLVISMCQAVVNRLAKLHESGQRGRYLRTVFQMIAGVVLICSVGSVLAIRFGSPLLQLVYSTEYAGRERILAILIFGAGFGYSALIMQYAATATRRFSIQILVYSLSGGVTLVLCILLTRSWGTEGAAIGRAIGWGAQFLLLMVFLLRSNPGQRISGGDS